MNNDSDQKNLKTKPQSVLGESVMISGDISGKEDILINCNLEGVINFQEHCVTISSKACVKANIKAKNIIVEGELKGELKASEQALIRPSGRVTGDIRAPRVVLSDGCQFKGSVDMEEISASMDTRAPKYNIGAKKPITEHPLKNIKKI